ncbi:hypothetical protein VTN77DRAFT_7311 [Rasamsonia byssochlamydoides]|uniref:uncharacterized protein n=1 Tax=Rasamsonia byssochlamydoides TaxID=89139 RepID=UPI003742A6A7
MRVAKVLRFQILKVSVEEFEKWFTNIINEEDIDIEYDARLENLIVKAEAGELHQSVVTVFTDWFKEIQQQAERTSGQKFRRRTERGLGLAGPHRGSRKVPDGMIKRKGEFYPVIALEVGVTETLEKLFEDAERLLRGSKGITQLVILVKITEVSTHPTDGYPWDQQP